MRKTSERQHAARRAREYFALDAVVKFCGSKAKLGAHFGVSYQAVQHWYTTGVPVEHCATLETLTRGKVQCEQLREDYDTLYQRPYRRLERVGHASARQRVYVAGPMTGYPEMNFPAFHDAAARLRALGLEVFNPAELNLGDDPAWEDCMRADLRQMMHCNAICMLPGWEASRGATLEHHIATTLGFHVMFANEMLEQLA